MAGRRLALAAMRDGANVRKLEVVIDRVWMSAIGRLP
jgi:hypothetical protein